MATVDATGIYIHLDDDNRYILRSWYDEALSLRDWVAGQITALGATVGPIRWDTGEVAPWWWGHTVTFPDGEEWATNMAGLYDPSSLIAHLTKCWRRLSDAGGGAR